MSCGDPRDIWGHRYFPAPAYAPFWQPPPDRWWPTYYPTTIPTVKYNYCPQCGIKLDEIMGYVCNNQGCPILPQITCELK